MIGYTLDFTVQCMNPEGRFDISKDTHRICEKKMNKDINMLLSSQSPLAFLFIETSQKNVSFLKKLMSTLANLIKAEYFHNLQTSESMINKYNIDTLVLSFGLLYNQWVFIYKFVRVHSSPLVTR